MLASQLARVLRLLRFDEDMARKANERQKPGRDVGRPLLGCRRRDSPERQGETPEKRSRHERCATLNAIHAVRSPSRESFAYHYLHPEL